ncbi:efflux RND transporter periplasmic adaptor subunit [Haloferula chungangensis]|uniref:Efflux RND transporter periplasmic adaptor subunit n=1 Tax=Haloferula chungangensis TaxID=1048331 RepID=A0ABW2L3J8_9BACT
MKSETPLAEVLEQNRNSHPLRRWVLSALILLAIAASGIWWSKRDANDRQGPVYHTAKVVTGDVALTITTTGTLEPTNQVTIGSEVSGTVMEVYVDINDEVKAGQELAKLDTTKLAQQTEQSRAALRSAKASVSQTQATLKESEATLTRLRELHELSGGRTPSKADMDAAIATVDRAAADLESAEAQVAQTEAALKANESDLGKAILRSPVDGIVLTRSIEPGQTVAAQFQAPELFVIAEDLSKMNLIVNVAEADIGRVDTGQPATFTVDAWPKRNYQAEVRKASFGSQVTDNVVTYETELDVSNNDLSLRPGMTATAEIAVAESKGVRLVPNTALRFDPSRTAAPSGGAPKKSLVESLTPGPPRRSGGKAPKEAGNPSPGERQQIWVLRDGQPQPIPVETGLSDGRNTEIRGPGIEAGLEVILSSSSGS